MKTRPRISSKALARVFEQGAEAWRKRDYQRTIDLLESVRRRDPTNAGILLDLGRAYGLRYNFSAAADCFEKAVRISHKRAEILAEAARRSLDFRNISMAMSLLDRATQEKGVPAELLAEMADLCEHASRFEQAQSLIQRALALEGSHPCVLLAQGRSTRLQGQISEAATLVKKVLANPKLDENTRVFAQYELAQILDQSGKYDEAMAALVEAKAVQRQIRARFPVLLPQLRSVEKSGVHLLSAGVLQRWAAQTSGFQTRRLAVLCGHPRSGTTLLEQMIDSHPEVTSAEETTIMQYETYAPLTCGFGESATQIDVLDAASPSSLCKARDDYFRCVRALLPDLSDDDLVLDKNPLLTTLIPAIVRIFPEAKLLIALREPRDVCLSCFMQYLPPNPVSSSYLSLGGTVDDYLAVMAVWLAVRPLLEGKYLEIRYEDLIENPRAIGQQALHFLGLNWSESVLEYQTLAKSKFIATPSYAAVRKPIYKCAVGRWRNYEKYFEPYMPRLAKAIEALGYS